MAKKQKQATKTCADCIHESACRIWTGGRFISDASASVCPNHETVKESGAYLCGVLDERNRKKTNADRIRAMSDEELAEFISNPCECTVDPEEDGYRECGNELCIKYLLKWLKQPVGV